MMRVPGAAKAPREGRMVDHAVRQPLLRGNAEMPLLDSVVPQQSREAPSLGRQWRLRLMGSVLALMTALMFALAIKDLVIYGAHSTAFIESLATVTVFLLCFLAFRYLGLETPVFLTVFLAGHAVLFYSIYMTADPHPAMVVWLPIRFSSRMIAWCPVSKSSPISTAA